MHELITFAIESNVMYPRIRSRRSLHLQAVWLERITTRTEFVMKKQKKLPKPYCGYFSLLLCTLKIARFQDSKKKKESNCLCMSDKMAVTSWCFATGVGFLLLKRFLNTTLLQNSLDISMNTLTFYHNFTKMPRAAYRLLYTGRQIKATFNIAEVFEMTFVNSSTLNPMVPTIF